MCGIIGYIGNKLVIDILIDGLKRMEYRGYDSAGLTVLDKKDNQTTVKISGKVKELEKKCHPLIKNKYTCGIAHTRWATHGEPTEINAHPHSDCKNEIFVVHNGIIENYRALKEILEKEGHKFKSQTDTEVIAHLIEKYYNGVLEDAVAKALALVEGAYGLAILSIKENNKIVAVRNGSPLILGIGEKEMFIASDVVSIITHTKQVIYLDDKEMAIITPTDYRITTLFKEEVLKEVQEVTWSIEQIEKCGYDHFMLKEIFEQPLTIQDAYRGRLKPKEGDGRLNGLNMDKDAIHKIKRIIFVACGTSWHAAMVGECMLEEYARIPVEVEYASEFRYRNPLIPEDTIVFCISQSGETADTLAALREAKSRGARVLGICNVVGSTIARESDGGVYIHAGPEIGVASTKAFTSQICALAVMTLMFARARVMSINQGKEIINALLSLPDKIKDILNKAEEIKRIACKFKNANNFLYLGRGVNFPVALEGALKMKEISYIHAEGYPAAEMKHGPIALIDENMPVVIIATKDAVYDKIWSNIEEVVSRKGKVIAIGTEGDTQLSSKAEEVIYIPDIHPMLIPVLSVIPLQLLAYYTAVLRNCPVDQPRNLAKSVTVE
ncbi:MAG: glutamine--fructose-6-phosphate transaminase (isomerizing) [Candidatus Hydrogenedentota bacterium]